MKLLINSVNTYQCPTCFLYSNFKFVSCHYIRTDVDLATMEGANESESEPQTR